MLKSQVNSLGKIKLKIRIYFQIPFDSRYLNLNRNISTWVVDRNLKYYIIYISSFEFEIFISFLISLNNSSCTLLWVPRFSFLAKLSWIMSTEANGLLVFCSSIIWSCDILLILSVCSSKIISTICWFLSSARFSLILPDTFGYVSFDEAVIWFPFVSWLLMRGTFEMI